MDEKLSVVGAFQVAKFEDNRPAEQLLYWKVFAWCDDSAGRAFADEGYLSHNAFFPKAATSGESAALATVYINVMGSLGGVVVAKSHLNISYGLYYHVLLEHLHFKAVYVGLLKALVFGLCIAAISCARGLRAENGALGVGRATRDAVVASFIMVLVIGYYITEVFFRYGL